MIWPSELRYAVGRARTLETCEEALLAIKFSYLHEAVTDEDFTLCLQLSSELGQKARRLGIEFQPESVWEVV